GWWAPPRIPRVCASSAWAAPPAVSGRPPAGGTPPLSPGQRRDFPCPCRRQIVQHRISQCPWVPSLCGGVRVREKFRLAVGDEDGVLVVGGPLAVGGLHGP